MARVSLLDVSREAMRARRVSISEAEVEPDDLRVWSSFSSDWRAVSVQWSVSQRTGAMRWRAGMASYLRSAASGADHRLPSRHCRW